MVSGVNVTQEEGHRPTNAKGTGGDSAACNSKDVDDGVAGGVERGGELSAPDGAPRHECPHGAEVCGGQGSSGAHVLYPGDETKEGAGVGVAGAFIPN